MTEPLQIRTLTGTPELSRALKVFQTAMVHINVPEVEDVTTLTEPGRTLGGFAGSELVATATSMGSSMVVPGGARLPHAAVTDVAVLPTHTRRGALTAVMRRQLEDIAARGEVVASLRASEGVIYERFGYGVATYSGRYELHRQHATLRPTVPVGSPVRLVLEPEEREPLVREVSERSQWVGAIERSEVWWQGFRAWTAKQSGPRHLTVAEGPDGVEGYVAYAPFGGGGWASNPDLKVQVSGMAALTGAAYIGLIRHLMALDLTRIVELTRPVDDPLGALFTNPDAVKRVGVHDETWLRLVDVEAALAARSYVPGERVVIAVSDPILDANTGSYLIAPSGVERVIDASTPSDVSVDVATLAAAYLGGTRWADLALAGRVSEQREGAIDTLDRLFATPRAPYAGINF